MGKMFSSVEYCHTNVNIAALCSGSICWLEICSLLIRRQGLNRLLALPAEKIKREASKQV